MIPFKYIYRNWATGRMSRVFANGPGDWGSIPDWVIQKTQKMVLDGTLLNTQHYKVRIKGKVEQSREWNSNLGVVAIEKGAFRSPSTKVAIFTYIYRIYWYNNIYIYISIDIYTYVCMYVFAIVCIFFNLSLSLYIYIYIYVCVCICVCMYMHRFRYACI